MWNFIVEFLHIGAVKTIDIKYSGSHRFVDVKYTISRQEILSNVFLKHLKYGQICKLEALIWDFYFGMSLDWCSIDI